MQTLAGRTCVFAGASGNIGRGAVRALAAGGMNVVLVTHSFGLPNALAEELKDMPGKVVIASNKNGDHAVFGDVYEEFGSVDVVIESTGMLEKHVPFEEMDVEFLKKKLSHHVGDCFMIMQAALPYLEKSKAPRMILTATAGALGGNSGENLADSISRGGVIAMTKALARELAPKGITVNCIARGAMVPDHDITPDSPEMDNHAILDRVPIGRLGDTGDYAALVAYLASEESGFMTGQILGLNGGLVI